MEVRIEIRPGEGGNDAKALVFEQAEIYQKYAARHGLSAEVIDETAGNS